MKHIGISILFIFFFFVSIAGDQDVLISQANKAYMAGSYKESVALYLKVAEGGYEAPELFFNLGNSFFKMNDYANAILWYERAKRLEPGNEDVDFNLNVANTKISDKIEPLPELFYKRWFYKMIWLMSVDTWAILSIVLFNAGLCCFILFLVSRVLILRKIGFWSGVAILGISFICLVFSWSGNNYLTSTSSAIVLSPTIIVKSSPDEKGTDLFVVHEGTKVILTDNISGWYEIRIANGSVGWLPESSLVKI